MKHFYLLLTTFVFFIVMLELVDAWRGNYYAVRRSRSVREKYCAMWYNWWGCSWWRYYWRTIYYTENICRPGWTHNGDQNCNIPVCQPRCQNGGTCTNPNVCQCPSWSLEVGCASLTCSYRSPCYPGDCTSGTECTCEPGFIKQSQSDGCIGFDSTSDELRPVVGKSNVTLSHIRKIDGAVIFMFTLEGLEEKKSGKLEIIWCNQKRFNNLYFEYITYFSQPENLPKRPNYVSEGEIGIVESIIEANVSKVPRDGGLIRDEGSFKVYKCEGGFSKDNPAAELATCVIDDEQFKTLIEHGDWLNIKFKSSSGGFQQLVNIDDQSNLYARKYYKGLQDIREVQFNFDFIAPKHCLETKTCNSASDILRVEKEFTKDPIKILWSEWIDELCGVWEYYIEVFKLTPDRYDKLIEAEPLKPVFKETIPHNRNIAYPSYKPEEPGMYSVLMETRDFANNSRIARRLVLFDDQSDITLNENPDGKLYVSSAVNETGYMWQTSSEWNDVTIDVAWSKHFINKIIEDNKLLYRVDSYPIQFKEIEDDGILYSQKFVQDSLDDNEGNRTLDAIENYHGIVKFEVATVLSIDDEEPKSTWKILYPFQEKTSIQLKLQEGSRVRVWVRATDVMGNVKTDSTLVRFDNTEPTISTRGDGHMFEPNIESTKFNFSSRIKFLASDKESGVHKIGFSITIKTTDKEDRVIYEGFAPASISNSTEDPLCFVIEGMCFKPYQNLYLDNCWFMVSKSDLDNSTASVEVYAYNQALLNKSVTFDIGPVKNLQGIEKYPENIRIESPTTDGFRVAWDIPKTASCCEKTETVLILLKKDGKDPIQTYYTSGSSKYYDITGLDSATEYQVNFGMKIPQAYAIQQTDISLYVKTVSIEGPYGAESNIGLIIGVIVGTVVILVVGIVVMIFLIRRGYIHPAKRFRSVRRSITQRVRNTTHKGQGELRQDGSQSGKMDYDNQESEMFIYNGMDVQAPHMWHINRNNIALEALIKNGHFANIYKARLDLVVAKTLKEQFTPEDELLMKAKIHFTVEKVGSHPNVLEFIGAVVQDNTMGPFMIYEYCENGVLRDYLVERKNNVSVEFKGNLFRFGLGIAKGMEFLAGKGIVHRRLAAQNILLNSQNEVKIYGFGPQSLEEEEGDAEKGEMNKLLKWMAPECMESSRNATEKSDVWSFGVVLWEIFSLGDIPYTGKDIDLPKRLEEGERLEQPEHCDDTWYAVMKKCWSYEASKRPTFESVRQELDNLHSAANSDD
ncbi:uncharacterized protein LOC132739481 isoform X2 [Ruditapes philippinarum]|uniref:uncharacterized protein LOC132739481 isoform X2 n=1 Tax=Ruditapes philippinarum TaxID=129788 RepID=UPI00295B931E|nr:uncharacterized protein LOC132739481 isoform X2 [Ruditapes philippinarum]